MKNRIKTMLGAMYRYPERVFVVLAVIFGTFSAIAVPQISITDEDTHLKRAYQVAQGQFVCQKATDYPLDIIEKSRTGAGGNREYTSDFTNEVDESDRGRFSCGSAAGYSPIGYLPQAAGIAAANAIHPTTGTMVLLARLANLILYVAAGYLIIRKVLVAKYVFFIVLLIPQMIHLAASLSADSLNNIVTLGIFALILNLFIQTSKISRKQIAVLITLLVSAALLKVSLFFILLPLLFLPVKLFKDNKITNVPFNIQKWSLGLLALISSALAYLLWMGISQVESSMVGGVADPIEDQPSLILNLYFNTYFSDYGDLVLRGVFGEFSSFLYHFPTILIIAQLALLLLAFLHTSGINKAIKKVRSNKWLVLSSTSAFVVSIIAITYGLYKAWGLKRGITLYADGVQGRYFTALLVLLIPFFAWVSKYISFQVKSDRLLFGIILAGQVIILGFYVLYTIRMLGDI